MRYSLVKPGAGTSGNPYIIIENDLGNFSVISPDSKLATSIQMEIVQRGVQTIEAATSGMSYYDITTNYLTESNKEMIRGLVEKWNAKMPEALAPNIEESGQDGQLPATND